MRRLPPDHAAVERGRSDASLRPLARPKRVRVHTDASQRPVALQEGGRTRRVAQLRERWRIDDEWWRRPLSRLYWEVVLEQGRVVTLYRDLVDGRWYRQ